MKTTSQFEFVPRDTEKSEFPDLVDYGCVAISVESGIHETLGSKTCNFGCARRVRGHTWSVRKV